MMLNDIYKKNVLSRLSDKLEEQNTTLADAIARKDLYLRVSLVDFCNLSCSFCHNEGSASKKKRKVSIANLIDLMKISYDIGFRRVQFTGGEPLLHPQVTEFVSRAKEIFNDVGITTNGVLLPKKLNDLIEIPITRIHVSLQSEVLSRFGNKPQWGIPSWLDMILEQAAKGYYHLRLNMPILPSELSLAQDFFVNIARYGCDIKVFSVLPEGSSPIKFYPIQQLENLVNFENTRRSNLNLSGKIILRGERKPEGLRCRSCGFYSKCKEQSRSLRVGADYVLRPCLASREWDIDITAGELDKQIWQATLLALDF